jgi:hypothetical protein
MGCRASQRDPLSATYTVTLSQGVPDAGLNTVSLYAMPAGGWATA